MNASSSNKVLKGIVIVLAIAIIALGGLVLAKNLNGAADDASQAGVINSADPQGSASSIPGVTFVPSTDDDISAEDAPTDDAA